jgi:hypothetical protein
MLGEAQQAGLKLNGFGQAFQAISSASETPGIEDARSTVWKAIDLIPRLAITNAGKWPARFLARPGASPRRPLDAIRSKTIWYHESVKDLSRFGKIPRGVELLPRPTLRTSKTD